jgi:hypothetical protein
LSISSTEPPQLAQKPIYYTSFEEISSREQNTLGA